MMTDHQKAQIIKLRADGNGYGKIAKSIGIRNAACAVLYEVVSIYGSFNTAVPYWSYP